MIFVQFEISHLTSLLELTTSAYGVFTHDASCCPLWISSKILDLWSARGRISDGAVRDRRHRFHQLTALILPVVVWNLHRSRANSCSADTCEERMNPIRSNGLNWNSVWFDFCFIEILEEKVKLFFQSTFFSVLRMFFCIVTFVKWKKTLQFMCFRIYVTWNSLAD